VEIVWTRKDPKRVLKTFHPKENDELGTVIHEIPELSRRFRCRPASSYSQTGILQCSPKLLPTPHRPREHFTGCGQEIGPINGNLLQKVLWIAVDSSPDNQPT